jgi:hypothetical protein
MPLPFAADRQQDVGQLGPVEVADPLPPVARRLEPVHGAVLVRQREADLGVGEGDPRKLLGDVAHFGLVGPQEFPPGRHAVEQVLHRDGRTGRGAAGPRIVDPAAGHADLVGDVLLGPARRDAQPRDRADARERLAAEAHRLDVEEVVVGQQLAGGVLGHAELQVVGVHADPVVADLDQLAPAVEDLDVHPGRAGIEGVFNELLHHARRPLDALAGGDPADQRGGQHAESDP